MSKTTDKDNVIIDNVQSFLGHGRTKKGVGKSKMKEFSEKKDPFPGPAPLAAAKLAPYKIGESFSEGMLATGVHTNRFKTAEKQLRGAERNTARLDLMSQEEAGSIEVSKGETVRQVDIKAAVDLASAAKRFTLRLPRMGPYRLAYSRTGRFLALGGQRGHVSVMEWPIRKLHCEIGVQEKVHDVCFLQQHSMLAVAQQRWTHIYDNQGLEVHCLKSVYHALRLQFLPYHLLLVAGTEDSFLHYIDVSTGTAAASFRTYHGPLRVLAQNPHNAVILSGNSTGTVCMWTPNHKNAVVKLLAHERPITAIAVDNNGEIMYSASSDNQIRLWDLRNLAEPLSRIRTAHAASALSVSQRGLLAASVAQKVCVYNRDQLTTPSIDDKSVDVDPLLFHQFSSTPVSLQFCPFEDVLGIGHGQGFDSLLVPGAGEANPDGLEANPLESRAQRRETQVKQMLDKLPMELIEVDTGVALTQVDRESVVEEMERKRRALLGQVEPEKFANFKPKRRQKGASKTGKMEARKKGVRMERKQFELNKLLQKRPAPGAGKKSKGGAKKLKLSKKTKQGLTGDILDRLIPTKE